jgi:hypothetical protein
MSTAFAQTADCMIQERYDVFILGNGSLVRSEGHTSASYVVGSPSGPGLACNFYVLDRLMHPLILGKPFIAQATAHTVLHDHRLGCDASFLYNSNEGSCLQRFGFSAAFKLG